MYICTIIINNVIYFRISIIITIMNLIIIVIIFNMIIIIILSWWVHITARHLLLTDMTDITDIIATNMCNKG